MVALGTCPVCGKECLDLCNYRTLVVVRRWLGLFTISCPSCGQKLTTLQQIPECLRDEVSLAAEQLHAGMETD